MSSLADFEPPQKAAPLIKYPQPRLGKLEDYKPVDTWAETNKAFKISSGVGLIVAATLNAVRTEKVGALGVITHSGGVLFALIVGGSSYKFFSCASTNLRQKDDAINHFYAGNLTGAIVGSALTKKLVPTVGIALGLGISGFLVHWCGGLTGAYGDSAGKARGFGLDNNFTPKKSDVIEKQEFWEVARRRPLSQTLEKLGEGAFKP
jgi:hypothetical protein